MEGAREGVHFPFSLPPYPLTDSTHGKIFFSYFLSLFLSFLLPLSLFLLSFSLSLYFFFPLLLLSLSLAFSLCSSHIDRDSGLCLFSLRAIRARSQKLRVDRAKAFSQGHRIEREKKRREKKERRNEERKKEREKERKN